MATPSQSQRPSPEHIFSVLTAFQNSAALKAAIELDIFTAIADGANRTNVIAQRVNAAERGVRILCDYLTIQGFLTKTEDRFALTQESAIFLNRHSPAYMGTLANFLASETHKKNFDALTESVKKGGTTVAQGDNTKPNDDFWVTFARSMAPLTTVSAGFIAELSGAKEGKVCKVLDIAAGHGMFGISIAKLNPNAQVTAVDWAGMIPTTKRITKKFGLDDRFKFIEGDIGEAEFGSGYDIATLGHILHSEGKERSRHLLKKTFGALKAGGTIAIGDWLVNDERTEPLPSLIFSVTMLINTKEGDTFSFNEIKGWLEEAGFKKVHKLEAPGPSPLILATKP